MTLRDFINRTLSRKTGSKRDQPSLTSPESEALFSEWVPVATEDQVTTARQHILNYLSISGSGTLDRRVAMAEEKKVIQALLDEERPVQAVALLCVVDSFVDTKVVLREKQTYSSNDPECRQCWALEGLIDRLLQRKLPIEEPGLTKVCDLFLSAKSKWFYEFPWARLVGMIERQTKNQALSEAIRDRLDQIRKKAGQHNTAEELKFRDRVQRLLDGGEKQKDIVLKPGDAWVDTLTRKLEAMGVDTRDAWEVMMAHAETAKTPKPSKKWLKAAEEILKPIGGEPYAGVMVELLGQIGQVGSRTERVMICYSPLEPTMIDETNADLLRGLIWSCALVKDPALIAALGQAAEQSYKKLTGIGPRAPKIGNACVNTLAILEDFAAVAQLSRLSTRVKHASVKKQINKALKAAAEKLGVTTQDLEESATPTFDMTEVGAYQQAVGDYQARIEITGTTSAELRWLKPDGKPQKTVPKPVKDEHADTLKALRQHAKQIKQMLPAVRDRLERLMIEPRSWSMPDWRKRYLDHPLVGTLARRMIWHFQQGDKKALAAWRGGELIDVDDQLIGWLDDETQVSLWHPIGFDSDTVLAWRNWMERRELTQPFKQAHREVYLITDAELETNTYSNRFASHMIRQHQLNALCQQRGWRYALQGNWDCDETPFIEIPQWNLRAEFWVDIAGDQTGNLSEAGIFLLVSTDQVRFYQLTSTDESERNYGGLPYANQPLPLTEVPAIPFSEVMRDVDLFVGVASVGNNPEWQDGGPDGAYRDYWWDYSFSKNLSASAKTRKDVLERLVPRLKIADRCQIDDRFLVVRGDVRTYKIHLGSSNILMEPNDQYLCIVPGRGKDNKTAGVFLPFEDDQVLSIILSKAFLLAEDTKITDPTILSQIKL